jgi:hypothetical protein
VTSPAHGYVTRIDLAAIGSVTDRLGPDPRCEVRLRVSVGAFVAYGDVVADAVANTAEVADAGGVPVVYTDNVMPRLLEAFETLGVVSSESMQHQNFTEVARALAEMVGRVPLRLRPRLEDVVRRLMSALGEHVLTSELDEALSALAAALSRHGARATADVVAAARAQLARSVGTLGSRSTRVPRSA